jgi:hypothetical protein
MIVRIQKILCLKIEKNKAEIKETNNIAGDLMDDYSNTEDFIFK